MSWRWADSAPPQTNKDDFKSGYNSHPHLQHEQKYLLHKLIKITSRVSKGTPTSNRTPSIMWPTSSESHLPNSSGGTNDKAGVPKNLTKYEGQTGEIFFTGQGGARPKIYVAGRDMGQGRAHTAFISWLRSYATAKDALICIELNSVSYRKRLQNRWIFGKVLNSLCPPPPPPFSKIMSPIFLNVMLKNDR